MSQITQRKIRVFISSTFRDMQAERDYLIKFIFPQLRKLCEQRRVTWNEVDLRWGITDEQSSEGKVLPICLAEIQRCKPYFIALLGERYGWIPEKIAPDLIEQEPWLNTHQNQSVTELEILYGVLNDPGMDENSLFYFRDPEFIKKLGKEYEHDFIEVPWKEDIEKYGLEEAKKRVQERRKKLEELKQRIRNSGLPLKENFQDPKQLGNWLFEDMKTIIDRHFPEGSQPDPFEQETIDHELFAASRAKIYIGGQHYFEKLNDFAMQGRGPLVVVGESGAGKSALLANWALNYRKLHPNEFVLMHFIGSSSRSVEWEAMLRRIMAGLQNQFGIQEEIPDDPDQLREVFRNWLYMVGAKGKVILVIDALNQLEDRQGAQELTWLPGKLPDNVKLILSTLPGKSLDVINEKNWPTLIIQPLKLHEREQLIRDYLAQYAKQLNSERITRIVAGPLSGNPLALRILLEELRQFGNHERLSEFINKFLDVETIPKMFNLVLSRCESDYELEHPGLVKEVMSYIWAGRRGVSEAELLDLLGKNGLPLPHRIWSPLYLALEQSFLNKNGLLGFYHDYINQAVEQRYLVSKTDKLRIHEILGDYFEHSDRNSKRTLEELPWQRLQGKQWQHLYDLLADLKFIQDLWGLSRFDLLTYWTNVETNADFNMIDAYNQVFENPAKFDLTLVNWLSLISKDAGYLEESMLLLKKTETIYRQNQDLEGLQISLGNQAIILYLWGRFDEALKLNKEKEKICREIKDIEGIQASQNNQVLIYKSLGNLDEAMKIYKVSEQICQQKKDLLGLSVALGNQAVILKTWGKLEQALKLHNEEEKISRQLENQNGLQRCFGNQALILQDLGQIDKALEKLDEQERICNQLGDRIGLQANINNRANIFADMGHLEDALKLYEEQEKICKQLGILDGLQSSFGNQALIYQKWNQLDKAFTLHKEEENICRQIGNMDGLQTCFNNQAKILSKWGKLDEAVLLYKESENICRQTGNLAGLQASLYNQANLLADTNRLNQALIKYQEQELISRQIDSLDGLEESLFNQADIYHQSGLLNKAMVLYQEGEDICRKRGNLHLLSYFLGNQALILQQQGDFNKAAIFLDQKVDICRQLGDLYGLCKSLGSLGIIFIRSNERNKAEKLLTEALMLANQNGFTSLANQINTSLRNY